MPNARFVVDRNGGRHYANGAVLFHTPGPFSSIARVENCPCPDGKRRVVVATAEADTFFTVLARITMKHQGVTRTVRGFLLFESGPFVAEIGRAEGPEFNPGGINAALLPPWPWSGSRYYHKIQDARDRGATTENILAGITASCGVRIADPESSGGDKFCRQPWRLLSGDVVGCPAHGIGPAWTP